MTMGMAEGAWRLAGYLRAAQRILMFTGAGISTSSGIPDFRGPQGVWTKRKPVYYQEFMSSEAARIEYWDYKLEGAEVFERARPNAVHGAIRKLEDAGKLSMVLTQNVDGLHAMAGTSAQRLLELHGTNTEVECQSCGWRDDPHRHYEYFKSYRTPPQCECGGFLKAATISFGQKLNEIVLERARESVLDCDLVIALGSTLSVRPACQFPLEAARRGVPYIVINRGETDHDDESCVSLRLDGDVGEIFPPAVDAALGLGHR
jgi:NAD-dependent deacetylase